MKIEELKEIFALLENAGWQPQLCDTPIPVYESVHAGNPVDPGNIPPDMALVPKAFLSLYRESMVRVKGNSMIDRGIEDGDMVRLVFEQTPREGDIVVVAIGTECTLKCYYEDDDGTRWLVPQNRAEKEKYKAIRLDDNNESVYLCGVVTELCKPLPRVPTKAMRGVLAEAKADYVEEPRISDRRVSAVIKMLAGEIKIQRHWYAVCRGMIDETVYGENEYDLFCSRVAKEVPWHQHLPRADEMQAMAVESFSKSVVKWDERRAPVKGTRFRTYKALGEKTIRLLTMKEEEFQSL
jgi:hypothetical protein